MVQEASAKKIVSAPIISEQPVSPVLLETGSHDEAVRYLASFRQIGYAGEYLVYVAESSLLLDLVRFKRNVDIIASFSADQRYVGRLSLANVPALKNQYALALSLTEGYSSEVCENQHFCPVT